MSSSVDSGVSRVSGDEGDGKGNAHRRVRLPPTYGEREKRDRISQSPSIRSEKEWDKLSDLEGSDHQSPYLAGQIGKALLLLLDSLIGSLYLLLQILN